MIGSWTVIVHGEESQLSILPHQCYGLYIVDPKLETLKKRWFFLGLATLSQVSATMIRMGIPALMPFIKKELNFSHTEVGLISSVLNGGAAAAGIPGGIAADRWGERMVIAYGTVASGILILGINWASSLTILFLFFLLIGFATTVSVPAGGRAVAVWFPAKERGTAMGLRQMAIPLAGAVAAMTLPSLAIMSGWRFALSHAGVFAIGMGFVALRFYEDPPISDVGPARSQSVGMREWLVRKDIYGLLFCCSAFSTGQWFYLTYLMLYLTETLQLSIPLAAKLLALGQFCGAIGRFLWGAISDRFFDSRRKPVLITVGILAILATLSTLVLSPHTSFGLLLLIVGLLGFTLQGWNGLTHTLASELGGSRMAGLAVGLANTAGFLGVIALVPAFGLLVDRTQSYRPAWLGVAVMIGLGVASLLSVKENER